MAQKCKTCGKGCEGDFCFLHKPRKKLKSQRKLVFHTDRKGRQVMANAMKMKLFFQEIWNKRPHKSEVSREYLGSEPSSAFFHHILPKSKYPDLAYKEDNIILLTMDEHANVESDIYRYEQVNSKRTLLEEKYL